MMKRAVLASLSVLVACGAPSPSSPDPSSSTDAAAGASATQPAPGDAGATPAPRTSPGPDAFGANVDPVNGGVVFRVWAPNATTASVTGDFPEGRIAMTPEPGGRFVTHAPGAHAGTTYRFVLQSPSGTITRTDPWCRELHEDGACTVIDPAAYPWSAAADAFVRPARNASVVYEMHVGGFTAAGTIAAARDRLAELADLGVDVVEVMPVHDFGGAPNTWGYNPQLFLAPKPGLASPDDLRAFVDEAHRRGIAVWLDVVMNHYDGWKKAPLACFDGQCPDGWAGVYFFAPGTYARTPWGPRPDYTQPEVARMLLGSVEQWLGEYRGDGFRWDSVSNIRALDGQGTTPGGKELLVAANARTHAAGATSIAEDLKGWDGITRAASSGGLGFDAQWDGFGYGVTGVLAGASDDARDLGVVEGALRGNYGGDPFARVLFTEDHDTVGNGGARLPSRIDPSNPTSWAARRRSMQGAVLLLTSPGVPMLFMGQEALATGGFSNPPAPLAPPTAAGAKVRAFYKDLIRLRRNVDGAAGGLLDAEVSILHRNDTAKVIAYRRHGASGEDVVVIVNLRNTAYARYDVGVPSAGPWRVRLNLDSTAYGDDFTDGASGSIATIAAPRDGQPFTLPLALGAYSAIVLTR